MKLLVPKVVFVLLAPGALALMPYVYAAMKWYHGARIWVGADHTSHFILILLSLACGLVVEFLVGVWALLRSRGNPNRLVTHFVDAAMRNASVGLVLGTAGFAWRYWDAPLTALASITLWGALFYSCLLGRREVAQLKH